MRRWTIGTIAALLLCGGLAGDAPVSKVEAGVDVPSILDAAAIRHGITPRFLRCLSWLESNWRPGVTSPQGDRGLMQFKTATFNANAWRYGWAGASPYDPEAAADVAAGMIAAGLAGHWPPAARCGSPWW